MKSERSSANALCRSSAAPACCQRALARVVHRQRGSDDQHLGQAARLLRRQQHAPDLRVERQLGQVLADRRQAARLVDRVQLLQQVVAVGDHARRGRIDEGEIRHIAQLQRRHAQDDAGQRGAQNFRIGKAPGPGNTRSEYRRMHTPAATRPQRPARWLAEACEIGSISS